MRGSLVFLLGTALGCQQSDRSRARPTSATRAFRADQYDVRRYACIEPQGDSPPGMQPRPNDSKQGVVPKK